MPAHNISVEGCYSFELCCTYIGFYSVYTLTIHLPATYPVCANEYIPIIIFI